MYTHTHKHAHTSKHPDSTVEREKMGSSTLVSASDDLWVEKRHLLPLIPHQSLWWYNTTNDTQPNVTSLFITTLYYYFFSQYLNTFIAVLTHIQVRTPAIKPDSAQLEVPGLLFHSRLVFNLVFFLHERKEVVLPIKLATTS